MCTRQYMNKRIIFIAPYPKGQAPSQRFRFEQYFSHLEKEGCTLEFHPFLSSKTWNTLYKEGSFIAKAFGMLGSFWRRVILLFKIRKADYVFIHREASMIGPPIFEWIIAKVLRKKYIYDFDDAIWLPNYSESNAKFHRLKAYGKVKRIIKWASVVSAGNAYLKTYAEQYNKNVVVIPTTIDLQNVHNVLSDLSTTPVNIVWTGTHTTMSYLQNFIPLLQELEKEHTFTFTIISNQKPDFELNSLRYIQWNKESEISDLAKSGIGVMPMEENAWSEGKCGFKGLQYMALGIPAILSPVGMNNEIIENGVNGFLCATDEEWKTRITQLLSDEALRKKLGEEGRKTVQERYSVEANLPNYLHLFNLSNSTRT